jgi:hypothetical protein
VKFSFSPLKQANVKKTTANRHVYLLLEILLETKVKKFIMPCFHQHILKIKKNKKQKQQQLLKLMFTLKYVPGAITGKPLNQKITNRINFFTFVSSNISRSK